MFDLLRLAIRPMQQLLLRAMNGPTYEPNLRRQRSLNSSPNLGAADVAVVDAVGAVAAGGAGAGVGLAGPAPAMPPPERFLSSTARRPQSRRDDMATHLQPDHNRRWPERAAQRRG